LFVNLTPFIPLPYKGGGRIKKKDFVPLNLPIMYLETSPLYSLGCLRGTLALNGRVEFLLILPEKREIGGEAL